MTLTISELGKGLPLNKASFFLQVSFLFIMILVSEFTKRLSFLHNFSDPLYINTSRKSSRIKKVFCHLKAYFERGKVILNIFES